MPKKKTNKYSLVLSLNGEEFTAKGNDLEKCLLSIKPDKFLTRGVLVIKSGNKEVSKSMVIPLMKKMFGVGGTNTQKIIIDGTVGSLKFLLGEK